jgi:hypothetical protein
MTKKEYQKHRVEAGINHDTKTCELCKARLSTVKANLRRRKKEEFLKGLGLTKVKGSAGGTFWE